MAAKEDGLARGKAKMVELFGPGADEPGGVLFEMAPKLGKIAQETLFGDVWADPALDTRLRSFITMAALVVLDRQPELRIHFRGALNLGIPREQIIALISHMAFYGGMPVALNSLKTAKEVFEKWDAATAKFRK
ncbi:MAG: carboxymuconolactone decarboxylase family protein [Chloroflexi bacterium]|nr:carboxymuconolactone decarboxylase family protein [Chloroflexota bacterium]